MSEGSDSGPHIRLQWEADSHLDEIEALLECLFSESDKVRMRGLRRAARYLQANGRTNPRIALLVKVIDP